MSGLSFLKRDGSAGKRIPDPPPVGYFAILMDGDGVLQMQDSDGGLTDLLSFVGALGMAQQAADAVAIAGGAGRFTTALGYDSSVRGSATQSSSKSTSVTMNAPTGKITMNAATLNADTTVSFTLNNTSIEAEDQLTVTHHSGGTIGSYTAGGRATGAGTASIWVRNITGGNLGEAIVLKVTNGKA